MGHSNSLFGNSPDGSSSYEDVQKMESSKATNPQLQLLENEEKKLSTRLKALCLPSGEEKRGCLEDSADILLSLGKVYLQRAILETGIKQKMSYIRCAVLLHAAIERFKIVKSMNKIHAVKEVCQEMSKSVLESCGSLQQADLLGISEKIFEKILMKRAEIQNVLDTDLCRDGQNDLDTSSSEHISEKLKALEEMESISIADIDRVLSPGGQEMEDRISERVRKINENVTTFYKEVMNNIATECLSLLPFPPCKFSIIALGSVARKEATLYSDFEHIILLQPGVDEKENFQSVLEYFRWFSVVFQLIVIGFGETIIPSVAVKSLNDFYSGDANSNWFYDNYTKNGISFDGMLPYACKIPLGRQQTTEKRTHVVELIKTPQKMAEYLTQDEQLKNGYHLADVLRQTCLVYGDKEIYATFVKERAHVLEQDKTDSQRVYSEMILKNAASSIRLPDVLPNDIVFDTKSAFYRPLAIYMEVIAKILGIKKISSFKIIDILHERKLVGSHTYRKMKYAFAVACEIRMMLYHKASQQRHGTEMEDVEAMIGKQATLVCKTITPFIKLAMERGAAIGGVAMLNNLNNILTVADNPFAVQYLFERDHVEEAIRLGQKLFQRQEPLKYQNWYYESFLIRCYTMGAYNNTKNGKKYMQLAENLCEDMQAKELDHDSSIFLDMDVYMAKLYHFLNMHQKCVTTLEKYFSKYFQAKQKGFEHAVFINLVHMYFRAVQSLRYESHLTAEEADDKLNTVLWKKTDNLECQLHKRAYSADRCIEKGQIGEDLKEKVRVLSADIQRYSRKLFAPGFLYTLVVWSQLKMWWLEDAAETLKFYSLYNGTRSKLSEQTQIYIMESLKLLYLCRLHGNQIATRVLKNRRRIEMSSELRDEVLLHCLASILWRGMNLCTDEAYVILALSWIIHLKNYKRMNIMFLAHQKMTSPRRSFAKVANFVERFIANHSTSARALVNISMTVLAMLLVAPYLENPKTD